MRIVRDMRIRRKYMIDIYECWQPASFNRWLRDYFRPLMLTIRGLRNPEIIQMHDFYPRERKAAGVLKRALYDQRIAWRRLTSDPTSFIVLGAIALFLVVVVLATAQLIRG